jgi:hypothetical protein
MTVEEIFSKISAHMVEGMMHHEQFSDYYNFLSLGGYCCCHTYHYLKETHDRAKLHDFFINKYNKLIPETAVNAKSIIPPAWFGATRFNVDTATKKNGIKTALTEWHKWEKETRDLYVQMYSELIRINEISAAEYIACMISDVESEIKYSESKIIELNSLGYDLTYIYSEQEHISHKYRKKIGR